VLSQSSKEKLWLQQSAASAELELDESLLAEQMDMTTARGDRVRSKGEDGEEPLLRQKRLQSMRRQLAQLLAAPVVSSSASSSSLSANMKAPRARRKKDAAVPAKTMTEANLRRGKGRGLFVFAK
jgi:CBS-domain-containing membrane protein